MTPLYAIILIFVLSIIPAEAIAGLIRKRRDMADSPNTIERERLIDKVWKITGEECDYNPNCTLEGPRCGPCLLVSRIVDLVSREIKDALIHKRSNKERKSIYCECCGGTVMECDCEFATRFVSDEERPAGYEVEICEKHHAR